MRLHRLALAITTGLFILACSGADLNVDLDEPLLADDDEVDGDEGDDGDTDDAEEGDTDEGEGEEETVEVDLGSAEAAMTTFAKAINASDSDALAASHTDDCDACTELADEAGTDGFELSFVQAKEKGDRAVGRIDACGEGDDCDQLVVYLSKDGDDWKLAWIDEDEDHARAYLRGKAPAKR
jgi:hypothetical protein